MKKERTEAIKADERPLVGRARFLKGRGLKGGKGKGRRGRRKGKGKEHGC